MTDEQIIQKVRTDFVDAEQDGLYMELTSKKLRTEWIKAVVETVWEQSSRHVYGDTKERKDLRALQKKAVEALLPKVTERAKHSDRLYKAGKL